VRDIPTEYFISPGIPRDWRLTPDAYAQVEEDEMGGACSTNGEKKYAYRLLVEKPEGKRQLGRPRRRLVDNIKIDLGEIDRGSVDRIGLAQDRDKLRALVNSVMNSRVEQNDGKLSNGFTTVALSSSVQFHRVS
jgi:hypothetical protein